MLIYIIKQYVFNIYVKSFAVIPNISSSNCTVVKKQYTPEITLPHIVI